MPLPPMVLSIPWHLPNSIVVRIAVGERTALVFSTGKQTIISI
jgi:hypothetical protein